MGREIERKFLVSGESWRDAAGPGVSIRQGYLAFGPPTAVRVRIAGDKANLNIKTATTEVSRAEYEYPIPLEDAEEIFGTLCAHHLVEKTRFRVDYHGMTWEVDVFAGVNQGLIVAELELESESQPFDAPPWLGPEVSHEPRYLNTHLSRHPYTEWPEHA
ncbi:MAG: CYTH domain-containing protein [Candidatus Hydrogenedentes bacterium]|nr:CYTH domain-containing protein [Candidatus Hydrogenedentota bacterium]